MKLKAAPKRSYRQGARARAAEETAKRIIEGFKARIREDWYDRVTLDEIAREAGVTVPTILRRFGSKEKLLEEAWEDLSRDILVRRTVLTGEAAEVVRVIVEDYEVVGDLVLRSLAQEERFEALKTVNDRGRAYHRAWLERAFEADLAGRSPAQRRLCVDALVCATDVYVWKLVRRDMGRSPKHAATVMLHLVEGALGRESNVRKERTGA